MRKPISSRETATLDAFKSEEFGLRRRAAVAPAPAKKGEANEGLRRVGLGLRARNSNVKYNEKEARESEGEEEDDDDAPRRRRLPAPKKETKAAPPRRTSPRSFFVSVHLPLGLCVVCIFLNRWPACSSRSALCVRSHSRIRHEGRGARQVQGGQLVGGRRRFLR